MDNQAHKLRKGETKMSVKIEDQQARIAEAAVANKILIELHKTGSCVGTRADFYSMPVAREVRAMCENCPVKEKCLDYAVKYELYGFWAGTNEAERKHIRAVNNIRCLDVFAAIAKFQGGVYKYD